MPVIGSDPHSRSVQRGGVQEYIRGRVTVIEQTDPEPEQPVDRSTLVSGTYNPVYYSGPPSMGGNYNTNRCGINRAPSLLTETEGTNQTFSTNGQIVTDTAFYRRISVTGQNITFRNCIFYGTPTDSVSPVICSATSANTTFEDCTFAPMAPQYNTYCARIGLGGGSFLRCDFYGGSDGISNSSTTGWPQQWTFTQCAFHDMLYFTPDPDAAGGLDDNASHTDLIQWGGGRLKIEGCGLWAFYDMTKYQAKEPNTAFGSGSTTAAPRGYPYHFYGNKYTDTINVPGDAKTPPAVVGKPSIYITSAVMFSPMYRAVEYFEMNNCYIDGSSYALNIGNTNTTIQHFKFTNNKVGKNHRWNLNGTNLVFTWAGTLESQATSVGTFTGNTDLASGAALVYADLD